MEIMEKIEKEMNRSEMKFGSHRIKELQEIWNFLGESAIEFEGLDLLELDENSVEIPNEELEILAIMWIKKLEE